MVINKNIRISATLKIYLDRNKLHPRETYDNVIRRLVKWSGRQ